MRIAKVLLVFGILLLLALLGAVAYGYRVLRQCSPQLQGTLVVKGLSSAVTVYREAHGIPHIYASNLDDVAFAQGYVTAQDRLWQMDIFRRNAKGDLAEVFGEVALKFDENHRRLGFREVADRGVESLDPESLQLLEHYAAGVNAFIQTHRDLLPIEFRLLRYQPKLWTPSDSLSIALMMSDTLNHSWERDLFRGKLVDKYGPQIVDDLYPTQTPYDVPLVGTDKVEETVLPPMISEAASPQKTPVDKEKDHLSSSRGDDEFSFSHVVDDALWLSTPEKSLGAVLAYLDSLNASNRESIVGSNNWVVDGKHSVNGKPLLANDPHLAYSVPSIWYQIHLHAPGLNVIGVSLAGAPGVIIGHNDSIAWGMTNLNPDVQDLFAEQFDGPNGTRYLSKGQWIDADERVEDIKIKGKPLESLRVTVTHHGPVLQWNGSTGYALDWTALHPDLISFPFLRIDQAATWKQFTAALQGFNGPAQNFVFASTSGDIGYYAAGKIPIRNQGTGNIPAPGNTDDFDWTGYVPFDDLPHLLNPPEGFIATANQRVIGNSYPFFITTDWEAPYRYARIRQLLTSKPKFSRDDLLQIQGDWHSQANQVLASFVLQAAQKVKTTDPTVQAALTRLKSGTFVATPESVETTIVEHLRDHLVQALLEPVLGELWTEYRSQMKPIFVEDQLRDQPHRWLPDEFKSYEELLIRSLQDVCDELKNTYHTSDVSRWVWSQRYPLIFPHALGRAWPLDRIFNVGPFPQGGTRLTVRPANGTDGASMRMVVDFSDLDHSYNNLTLGESGQVFSPYYKDQLQAWRAVESFPMYFSDEAVRKNAKNVLTLQP
ncbi:MAG: penicillin acylase family protein [Acidobacteriia bacterium]|nr:penicillin acylase family protein [Terriglobia bacterium]